MPPGLLYVLLAASPAPVASADPPSLQLEWSAPAACPSRAAVLEMAAKLLGRPLGAAPATTQVRARVRAAAGAFALTIETRSPSGTDRRVLQDARCSVLAESAAVIAATAVDPSVGGLPAEEAGLIPPAPVLEDLPAGPGEAAPPDMSPETGDPPPFDLSPGTGAPPPTSTSTPPPVQPAIAPVLVDEAPAPTPPVTPARVGPRIGLRLGGLFDLGSAPGPTGGLALTLALFDRLWRAELTALWIAPRTTRPDPALELGAQVGVFAAGLRGCGVPRLRRLEVPVCGGVEAGVVRGRGVGAALGRAATDDLPWLALTVGPGLTWAVRPRLALSLALDLVVPLFKPIFAVQGRADPLYSGAPAAGRATLGLEWRFR